MDLNEELKSLKEQRENAKVVYFKFVGAVEVMESLIKNTENSTETEKPVAKKNKK